MTWNHINQICWWLLEQSNGTQLSDSDLDAGQVIRWKIFRQQVRDLDVLLTAVDPADVTFPQSPDGKVHDGNILLTSTYPASNATVDNNTVAPLTLVTLSGLINPTTVSVLMGNDILSTSHILTGSAQYTFPSAGTYTMCINTYAEQPLEITINVN